MQKEFEHIVAESEKGERIDHFLAGKKEIGLARSQIQRLIRDGYVEVNRETPKASYHLKLDDRIILNVPPPEKTEVTPEYIPLDVVYEDGDLIVVNKPKGMVVHPAAGNYSGTLVNALLSHCRDLSGIGGVLRPGIVHRLDKNTSGLIVAAKNDFAHQALAAQFKNRQITKQYVALVHGELRKEEGTIEARIGRHPLHRKKMAVISSLSSRTSGRDAVSHYKVRDKFKNYTLVEVILGTGRTHQIRVHMNHIGHPIVGDPVYGHRREEFKVEGQLLHAEKIGFIHPRTGKPMEFYRAMPHEMKEIIRKLQKA